MKRIIIIVLTVITLTGCVKKIGEEPKQNDLQYTVLPEQEVPEEIAAKLNERKSKPFTLTYADQGYLYIAQGYGTQPTSGYSISVDELYDTKSTICFKTVLIGPKQSEETKEVECYPYIVVKTEYMDKEVMFD